MGRRRSKAPRVEKPAQVAAATNKESDGLPTEEDPSRNELHEPLRRKARNQVKRMEKGFGGTEEGDEATLQKQVPFCCSGCDCSDKHPERLHALEAHAPAEGKVDYWISPAESPAERHLYHLKCCHGVLPKAGQTAEEIEECQSEWCDPFTTAVNEALEKMCDGELLPEFSRPMEWVEGEQIIEAYCNAKKQESQFYNEDECEGEHDRLLTSSEFVEGVQRPYDKHKETSEQNPEERQGVVVLEAFAGVGTGIVALKRLGIRIKKVIHIEHDKVATHVYRTNHDASYSDKGLEPDGIEHVYEYQKWEDLVGEDEDPSSSFRQDSIACMCANHGPIDIVIGGPPCVDYSMVNAYRRGAEGKQGSYLVDFGNAIRIIEAIQKPHPLYFLAENVVITGDDLGAVNQAFGFTEFDPVKFDSMYVSPARRNRNFWTNIPCENLHYTSAASEVDPECCLEDKFYLPAQIVCQDTLVKCNCLMASRTRIDDPNTLGMYVFKKEKDQTGRYHGRPLTVAEREKFMGFPENYVEGPVKDLFSILRDNALAHQTDRSPQWRDALDAKYHTFKGNYHNLDVVDCHRYDLIPEGPFVTLKLAPPVKGETNVVWFHADDYAKHLIGNAFSVPVMEALLKPLTKLFASTTYPGYDYEFAWEEPSKPAAVSPRGVPDASEEETPKPAVAPSVSAKESESSQVQGSEQELSKADGAPFVAAQESVAEEPSKPAAAPPRAPDASEEEPSKPAAAPSALVKESESSQVQDLELGTLKPSVAAQKLVKLEAGASALHDATALCVSEADEEQSTPPPAQKPEPEGHVADNVQTDSFKAEEKEG